MRQIAMGERLPRGYAVAWPLETVAMVVVLPVGVAHVVGWLRARWIALRVWYAPDVLEAAYLRGLRDGQQIGCRSRQIMDWHEAKAQIVDDLLALTRSDRP